ncbi:MULTISPECIES: adenosylcobinamide-phosphate synthase CbiB [unclassified Caulobacter]|uniref:adenosylcobinamide-phosphate synthase CbiB n=1 Tax=unclassified Caulobacter TaxID=2648921 RepID=UPI0006FDBDE0|nr:MULTISPECIES: adenosylcobinamide-phosphate synthase CbiB [unclassified Caulobacter]KQV57252.1 adenosylcobinamide-phosphate synthase [Caulobacter sp. Root342]KQV66824.1 adenosylcobinamide-phosphate synthase [Caulobacter sp. Root343]
MSASPWIVLGAALLDAAVGYPDALHRRIPHPVAWLGGLISALEAGLNRPTLSELARRMLGVATLLIIVGVSGGAGWLITRYCGPWVVAIVGALGLAQRSLFDHVRAVAEPLSGGGLDGARTAVGRIIGRDVERLDESGVATAAIESLAESFNDGVVAPMFWFVVGGLPGLFVYKAVNTADSLIGHREPRWRSFGWASARFDDLLNLIPARIAGGLVALAGGSGWRIMFRDAGKHASPNAGWPEAAMAGALGVRLGGPAWYDGALSEHPVLGKGGEAAPADLARALRIYLLACAALWSMLLVGGLAWPR